MAHQENVSVLCLSKLVYGGVAVVAEGFGPLGYQGGNKKHKAYWGQVLTLTIDGSIVPPLWHGRYDSPFRVPSIT